MNFEKAIDDMCGNTKPDYLDISHITPNNKAYGGLACIKVGITLNGEDYLVKYPGKLKGRDLKNVNMSYSNGPVSEYLGSMFFKMFGMDVHDVRLVKRNNKICAMCKDFTNQGELVEFREIKQSYEPGFLLQDGLSYDGAQTELSEVLEVIRNHHILKGLDYEEFFWKMFIIDAIIGNHDRNTGNFGILQNTNGNICIAPVYDNGNSFNPSWDENKILQALNDSNTMNNIAYNAYTCRFTNNGKQVNPFQYIENSPNYKLRDSLSYVVSFEPDIFKAWIESQNCITDIQKNFYCRLINLRFAKLYNLI